VSEQDDDLRRYERELARRGIDGRDLGARLLGVSADLLSGRDE